MTTRVYKGHTIDINTREIFQEGCPRVVDGYIVDYVENTNSDDYTTFDSVAEAICYINTSLESTKV